jgi:hypothetical protein
MPGCGIATIVAIRMDDSHFDAAGWDVTLRIVSGLASVSNATRLRRMGPSHGPIAWARRLGLSHGPVAWAGAPSPPRPITPTWHGRNAPFWLYFAASMRPRPGSKTLRLGCLAFHECPRPESPLRSIPRLIDFASPRFPHFSKKYRHP